MHTRSLKQATELYASGNYPEAERVCRSQLKKNFASVPGWLLLSKILLSQRDFDGSQKASESVLALDADNAAALNVLAIVSLERDHDRAKAIGYLSQAISAHKRNWEALANLGHLYIEEGMEEEGAAMLRRSLAINQNNFAVHNGLGILEKNRGRLSSAIEHFQRALALRPNNQAVRNNLASCGGQALLKVEAGEGHKSPAYAAAYRLAADGDYAQAAKEFNKLATEDPENREILAALAKVHLALGNIPEAKIACDRLMQVAPEWAETHSLMGFLLGSTGGNLEEITAHFKKSSELAENDWLALINLANLAIDRNSIEDAEMYFRKALKLSPGNIKALNGLAYINTLRMEYGAAADLYAQMFASARDNPQIATNLITALSKANRRDEALEVCLSYLDIENPDVTVFTVYSYANHACLWDVTKKLLPKLRLQIEQADSSLASFFVGANLGLMAEPDFPNEELFLFHDRIGTLMSQTRTPPMTSHPDALTRRSRLRIGYISADFNAHSVSFFFSNIFQHHDREQFEIFLYSNTALSSEDHITAMYRREAEKFVCIYSQSDEQVAARIANDGINVLVDLGGYTERSRLNILAYRPAPVQISYLGYPATTGMRAVDYVITDRYLNGPDNPRYFVEQLLELPDSFICFGRLRLREISSTLPLDSNAYVTFGSLTNPYKLNERTLDLWCQVMHALPNSRFYLNHPRFDWKEASRRITQEFVSRGIDAERVSIESRRDPSGSHLAFYSQMDISLDTMPLTGGTTTVDALSMGIPVVTRVGEVFHQRISYSVIMNTGLEVGDLIAFDDEDFVAKAIALASNPERIRQLRTDIPKALLHGILCDPERFTRQLEDAYFRAWKQTCPSHPIESFVSADKDVPTIKRQYGLVSISTSYSDDDLYRYVMRERGHWYEHEATLLPEIADLFPLVWDIATDPGVYAIPTAIAQLQSGGRTIAVRDEMATRKLILRSAQTNRLANLTVKETVAINAELPPDLIRLALESDSQTIDWLENYSSVLKESSPAVLLHAPIGHSRISHPILTEMGKSGYKAFRVVPSLGLLIEAETGNPRSNLLFCRGDKRKRLTIAGILVDTLPAIDKMATDKSEDWLNLMRQQPGLVFKIFAWLSNPRKGEYNDLYYTALSNLFGAYFGTIPSGQRLLLLELAKRVLATLIRAEATVPRVLTAIRVFADSGEPAFAITLATDLAQQLAGQSGPVLDEPFLHPFPEWRRWAPPADEAQWAYSLALAAAERLAHPTSYFTPDESRSVWETLARYPWFATEASRLLQLIDTRQARTTLH